MNNDKHTHIHRYKNDFKFAVKPFTGIITPRPKTISVQNEGSFKKIQT